MSSNLRSKFDDIKFSINSRGKNNFFIQFEDFFLGISYLTVLIPIFIGDEPLSNSMGFAL